VSSSAGGSVGRSPRSVRVPGALVSPIVLRLEVSAS
jgi:hypothetical protein